MSEKIDNLKEKLRLLWVEIFWSIFKKTCYARLIGWAIIRYEEPFMDHVVKADKCGFCTACMSDEDVKEHGERVRRAVRNCKR